MELEKLRAQHQARKAESKAPGSWGALVAYWRSTPEWAGLKPRTKQDYQRVLDYLAPLDAMPLVKLDPAGVMTIRNKAYAAHKRRFANYVLAVISRAWNIGQAASKCPFPNPVSKEQKVRRPNGLRDVNRPWTPAEVETVFATASRPICVAMALALFAGWREGDVASMTTSAYDGTDIEARQGKTGELVRIPAHSVLKAILDAEIARQPRLKAAALILNERGRPYTENGFRSSFFRLVRALRASDAIASGLTFHGLRTTLATWLANGGADTRTIAAALGHATEAMAIHYARNADKRRRASAAVTLLEQVAKEILERPLESLGKSANKA